MTDVVANLETSLPLWLWLCRCLGQWDKSHFKYRKRNWSTASQFLGPQNVERAALRMRPLKWDSRLAKVHTLVFETAVSFGTLMDPLARTYFGAAAAARVLLREPPLGLTRGEREIVLEHSKPILGAPKCSKRSTYEAIEMGLKDSQVRTLVCKPTAI
ncbi:uncharacterized protein [Euphorbia lathyris]|uniref:uncharacterized protein n=1 Tax=Euphorbia lathyris TaxID=212925 RepID=UPI0033136123